MDEKSKFENEEGGKAFDQGELYDLVYMFTKKPVLTIDEINFVEKNNLAERYGEFYNLYMEERFKTLDPDEQDEIYLKENQDAIKSNDDKKSKLESLIKKLKDFIRVKTFSKEELTIPEKELQKYAQELKLVELDQEQILKNLPSSKNFFYRVLLFLYKFDPSRIKKDKSKEYDVNDAIDEKTGSDAVDLDFKNDIFTNPSSN